MEPSIKRTRFISSSNVSLDMPITFMGSNGDGGLRKLVAVDNIMIRTMKNDSIVVGQEPETDLREVNPPVQHSAVQGDTSAGEPRLG